MKSIKQNLFSTQSVGLMILSLSLAACSTDQQWRRGSGSGLANQTTAGGSTSGNTDTTGPEVTSFTPVDGSTITSIPSTIIVQFDEDLESSTVDITDFTLTGTCSVLPTIVSASETSAGVVTITTTGGSCQEGKTIIVTVKDNSVEDPSGNTGPGSDKSATYTYNVGPDVTSFNPVDGSKLVSVPSEIFVFFNEDISGVATGDFEIIGTCSNKPSINSAARSAAQIVRIGLVGGSCSNGQTLGLKVKANHVADLQGALGPNVDKSALYNYNANVGPKVTSFSPPNGASLDRIPAEVYVYFNEDIKDVAKADFEVTGNCATRPTISNAVRSAVNTVKLTLTGGSCSDGSSLGIKVIKNSVNDLENASGPASDEYASYTIVSKTENFTQSFTQPGYSAAPKLDLLFVGDASTSMDGIRASVAKGLGQFVGALPTSIDLRVAVLFGYGAPAKRGKIFQKDASDPFVLTYSPGTSTVTLASVQAALVNKFTGQLEDNSSPNIHDGGELMIRNISEAIGEDRAFNQSKGFFRNDATLAIIVATDENDICATPNSGKYDQYEVAGYDAMCKTPKLDHNVLASQLSAFKGSKVIVSAVAFKNSFAHLSNNEASRADGIIELVQKMSTSNSASLIVDLKHPNTLLSPTGIADGLKKIGQVVAQELSLRVKFQLKAINILGIDEVRVDGGLKTNYTFNSSLRQIELPSDSVGTFNSVISVKGRCTTAPGQASCAN